MNLGAMSRKLVRPPVLLSAFAAVCVLLVIGMPLVALLFGPPDQDRTPDEQNDPGARFTTVTGLSWPATASLVSVRFIDMFSEYEYQVVFDIDSSTLNDWVSRSPPWGQKEWLHGPLPKTYKEQSNCMNTLEEPDAATGPENANGHTPLPPDDKLRYSVDPTASTRNDRFGPLLIIDLRKNRVCLEDRKT